MITPPDFAIRAAVEAGARSPCAKSKRGAAVFDPEGPDPFVFGVGWNAQPSPFVCTGDAHCRAACGKLCVHAEARAIRGLGPAVARGLELVHAKVVDGQLVAGGGPSCWQCSREILDAGIAAVWLYKRTGERCTCGVGVVGAPGHASGCMACPINARGEWEPDRWRRYTTEEFHRATLAACGIEVPRCG